jgi:hypothetical protein
MLRAVTALASGFRVGCSLVWLLLSACGDSHRNVDAAAPDDKPDAAAPMRKVKARTVSIGLFKTGEWDISPASDGSFEEREATDMGGVEVCVAQRRPAFASFQPFEVLDPPTPCTTSKEGEEVQLEGVPADADLIITLTKEGYQSGMFTFRTDDRDQGAPLIGTGTRTSLVRSAALDAWLESDSPPSSDHGVVGIYAGMIWTGATPVLGEPFSGLPPFVNYTLAEDVSVAIEGVDGGRVGKMDGSRIAEWTTLRERQRWVALAPGLYRFRFSHPRLNLEPALLLQHYTHNGFPTDTSDTIEVPVLAGYLQSAGMNALCAAPVWGQEVEDLATCTPAPPNDAGLP